MSTQLKGRSKLFIKPGSLTAAELCKLEGGCFTERTARLDLEADQTGLAPRWTFAVDIANDGVTVFRSDLHTAEAGGVLSAKMTSTYEALKTIDVDITLGLYSNDLSRNLDSTFQCDEIKTKCQMFQRRLTRKFWSTERRSLMLF